MQQAKKRLRHGLTVYFEAPIDSVWLVTPCVAVKPVGLAVARRGEDQQPQ